MENSLNGFILKTPFQSICCVALAHFSSQRRRCCASYVSKCFLYASVPLCSNSMEKGVIWFCTKAGFWPYLHSMNGAREPGYCEEKLQTREFSSSISNRRNIRPRSRLRVVHMCVRERKQSVQICGSQWRMAVFDGKSSEIYPRRSPSAGCC